VVWKQTQNRPNLCKSDISRRNAAKSRRIKERDGKGAEGRGADESQDRGDMRVESLREPVRRRSGDSGGCTAEVELGVRVL